MHWARLIQGSTLYRQEEPRDVHYQKYMAKKDWEGWQTPDVPLTEVQRLVKFLNQWRSRYPSDERALVYLQENYRQAFPIFTMLAGTVIEDVVFDDALTPRVMVSDAITEVFDRMARTPYCNAYTAGSKILHMISPSLFTMWDTAIRGGYAVGASGSHYASRFLPRIQNELTEAIATLMKDKGCDRVSAIKALGQLGGNRHLTKLIDECNYAKFTLNLDELWTPIGVDQLLI